MEVYQYEKFRYGNALSAAPGGRRIESDEVKPRSAFAVQRAQKHIFRLLSSNPDFSKFVTLTFARNEQNLDVAYYEHKMFMQRLKYFLQRDMKYLTVIEFQKRGAVHFHSVLDAPYIQKERLQALWGNGFVKINEVDDPKNLSRYVSKYLGKETDLLKGRKKYFHSRNVEKPKEYIFPWFTEAVGFLMQFQNWEKKYDVIRPTEYYGNMRYQVFEEPLRAMA